MSSSRAAIDFADGVLGVGQDAGHQAGFGAAKRFSRKLAILSLAAAMFVALLCDLVLKLKDRRVGDDIERAVEKLADRAFAVLARFGPKRRKQEFVAFG